MFGFRDPVVEHHQHVEEIRTRYSEYFNGSMDTCKCDLLSELSGGTRIIFIEQDEERRDVLNLYLKSNN